eukprot:scaffold39279_cov160-Amphora_coffeaeformis.AAC.2
MKHKDRCLPKGGGVQQQSINTHTKPRAVCGYAPGDLRVAAAAVWISAAPAALIFACLQRHAKDSVG